MNKEKQPNQLIHESSPYLLQHAYNPVKWYPWNEETLQLAKNEDKPILVSIGYSSCHWCHVMEHESFENAEIAAVMNEHFICIKVDREERPDVDQIYMDAVQLMGIPGGWPLNVFLTPDQKPFYGGTYFRPQSWNQLLRNVAQAFAANRKELDESAEKFTQAITISDLQKFDLEAIPAEFDQDKLDKIYQKFSQKFDSVKGGMDKAPKFPMPSNWSFTLRYYFITQNKEALDQALLTLRQMANGGIYDHIGGGFARYSVDKNWFLPHFEKMLYDNGQLLSLYAEAYNISKDEQFKSVVVQTVEYLRREMLHEEGGFYSGLDADSEGEEGKFYVWSKGTFKRILEESFDDQINSSLICEYFGITDEGNWEPEKNILKTDVSLNDFAEKHQIDPDQFRKDLDLAKKVLLVSRNERVRPGLDDKILAGWNALVLKGLVDAYLHIGDQSYLTLAESNAKFIRDKLINSQKLYRSYKNGESKLDGYLEDYALVIQAFLSLYQANFDEQWLYLARDLVSYTDEKFFDQEEHLYFYTDASSSSLIARKKEIFDNVIPASNSVMANNLYQLGLLLDEEKIKNRAIQMLRQIGKLLESDIQYLSNWAIFYTYLVKPTAEIAISGEKAKEMRLGLEQRFYPNKILVGSQKKSELPLLQNRAPNNDTMIYVCYNKTCQLPVSKVKEALNQLV